MLAGIAALAAAGYLHSQQSDQARVHTANALALAGNYEGAVKEAQLVTRSPARESALLVEARALDALRLYAQADRAYVGALRLDPQNSILHYDRALALIRARNRTGAKRELQRALDLDPRLYPIPPGFRLRLP